jgi:oligopeptide/dipeptide ABC transporter ATP-binding protein
MTPSLLEVRDLKVWFPIRRGLIPRPVGHVRAVDGVTFEVGEREVLGVAGESGSGKTTIGRSVLRLIEPTTGDVRFRGRDVRAMPPSELRAWRREAQIVFQDPYGALDPRMTIARILSEPLDIQGTLPRAQRRDRVVELLELVALGADYLDRKPRELSGGQRQRIVIARALALKPSFIVADEPVSALDVSIQAQIIALLNDIKDRFGLSLLFISHDLAVMEYLSDRVAVVYLGKIMEIGPAASVCNSPSHPYTRALVSAAPGADAARARERIILKGDLPSPRNPPSGCVFRTRCPLATELCAREVPPAVEVAPGHVSACHFAEAIAARGPDEALLASQ